MARILHLSDLHFGAHDPRLVEAVEIRVDEAKADLVVISGDFTQRARTEQFEEACQFLTRLKDGGHELPDAAVLGINTARSLTFKDGRINDEQVEYIRATFARVTHDHPRILVTHHPLFALPVGDGPELGKAIGRQELALDAIADAGVDLLLAGHNHRASTHHAPDLVTRAGSALVIQAGTATSTRLRDEEQSFNIIEVAADDVTIAVQAWDGNAYASCDAQRYRRVDGAWKLATGVTQGASAETAAVS